MFNKKSFLFIITITLLTLSIAWFVNSKLLNNNSDYHTESKEIIKKDANAKKSVIKDDFVQKDVVEPIVIANDNDIVSYNNNDSLESDNSLQELMDLLSLNAKDVINGQKQFEYNPIFPEWEARMNSKISGLSEEKKETIRKNHLTSLFIKDQLDLNYLENENIGQMDYQENLAKLFKWHQTTYREILSEEEYEQLLEVSVNETDDVIDGIISMVPEIEITNPKTTVDDVYENVPIYKIESLTALFKERELSARTISKAVNAGEMSVEEAGEIWNDCYQNYIDEAKNLLDKKEFELIFGSLINIK
ncbi:hypothetical protein KAS41_02275 [Candidatus Parcubacteria bacterium]|nr:hypothetical protein [Candidatus Parcubacteria bacterium]